jgi:hypothetical protein
MDDLEAAQPRDAEKELEIEKLNNAHNNYATSKSNSQNFINTGLVISLANTLINIVAYSSMNGWNIATIVFISASISIQIVMGSLLVVLSKATTEKIPCCFDRSCTATRINSWVTILSMLLPIISAVITALDRVSAALEVPVPPGNGTATARLVIHDTS